jgi:hypothetical protein
MKQFEEYRDGVRSQDNNKLSHVQYFPVIGNPMYCSEEATSAWYEYLLSLPFIVDSLQDLPNLGLVGRSEFEVCVRTDIPADRLMNVLALFRYPHVAPGIVEAFTRMCDAEVDEAVAFTVAVGVINPGYCSDEEKLYIYVGMDTEHAFIHARHFTIGDAQNMVEQLLTEDWEDLYSGRQATYCSTGVYFRNGMSGSLDSRLTAFAGPSIGSGTSRAMDNLSLPWLAFRQVDQVQADSLRSEGEYLNTLRPTSLVLDMAKLLNIVCWFEGTFQ